MTFDSIEHLMRELARPFHPSDITFKPGATSKDKDRALALAYADLRAYMDRLDALFPGQWESRVEPWGDERIRVGIALGGWAGEGEGKDREWISVMRWDVGETSAEANRGEIGGTVAFAQAFKRACVQFGMGRYLYAMPQTWQAYDAKAKQFTPSAKAALMAAVIKHYNEWNEKAGQAGADLSGITLDAVESLDPGGEQEAGAEEGTGNIVGKLTEDDYLRVAEGMSVEDHEFYQGLSPASRALIVRSRLLQEDSQSKPASEAANTKLARELGYLAGAGKESQVSSGAELLAFITGTQEGNPPKQEVVSRLLDTIPATTWSKELGSQPNPKHQPKIMEAAKEIGKQWFG